MASIEYVVRAVDGASTTFAKIAAQADALNAQMDDLGKQHATPSVELQDKLFQIRMTSVQARLDDLRKQVAEARVGVTDKDAVAKLAAMNVRLDMIGKRVASPRIDLTGAARAEAQLLALDASLSHVTDKLKETGPAAGGAGAGLAGMATPMAGLAVAGVALAPVLVTVGFGMGGLGLAASGVISPVIKASQAAGGLQANLRKLDPEQRAAALSLLGLQKQYQAFQASLKPVVLGDFNAGLHVAASLMHDVGPVTKATGTAIGQLLGRIDAEFASGTWQNFFGFMAQHAGPDVRLLGDAFMNLTDALPRLLTELQPLANLFLLDTVKITGLVNETSRLGPAVDRLSASTNQLGVTSQKTGGVTGFLKTQFQDFLKQMNPGIPLAQHWIDKIAGAGNASEKAAPKITQTAAALDPVKVAAQEAAAALTVLNTDWNTLIGNFATKDQVLVNTAQAFDAFKTSIKQTGDSSLATRGAFDSYLQQIGSGLDTLRKAGASNADLNSYLQTQISRLRSLGPLNRAQAGELAALRKYADELATSTAGMNKQQLAAARTITGNFVPGLVTLGVKSGTARGDLDRLANSILNTGTKSDATHGARQHMISDLEKSGLSASTARGLVDLFIKRILAIPRNASTNVTATGSASGKLTFAEQIMGQNAQGYLQFHAAGGLLRGGVPGRDSILMMGMPGEVVVPTGLVQAGAVDHLRGKLPGFAGGGLVGAASQVAGEIPWMSRREAQFLAASTQQTVTLAAREMSKLAAAAAAVASASFGGGPGGGAPSANAALARRLFPQWGSGANWAAWNYVAMRESGWSQFARNPSSGAYGIPQALPPSKMGAAANPPQSNPTAQIRWMASYMAGRYGGPIGAAAHERAFNWYDRGGYLPPGASVAVNNTGQPEQVLSPGDTKAMIALLRQILAATNPAAHADALTRSLNGVAAQQAARARYSSR